MKTPTAVGSRIRELREVQGISMETLARKANISLSAMSGLETGTTKRPTWNTVLAVAQALGVTPNDLRERP